MKRSVWLSMCFVLAACATTPRPPPPPPPAERSSISAVLAHADELGLSPAQVTRLSQLDDQREVKARETIAEFRAKLEAKGPPPGAMTAQNLGGASTGMGGVPLTGGAMDASGQSTNLMGPPGRGGRRGRPPGMDALEARLDELDTQAYFLAEPMLDDAQKALAQKYATKYRVSLYNWRDAQR